MFYDLLLFLFISTHALTWRATKTFIQIGAAVYHFYPRPHMEGDTKRRRCGPPPSLFLPTPSHGGRQSRCRPNQTDQTISTHALTWRATCHRLRPDKDAGDFYPRPHMEGDSKHAEVQACISAAYLKCSTRKAAASRRCADLGGRAVLFHQLSRLVLGRARCEPRGEGMCDRGSHRQSGRRKGLKTHSSKMSSWLH